MRPPDNRRGWLQVSWFLKLSNKALKGFDGIWAGPGCPKTALKSTQKLTPNEAPKQSSHKKLNEFIWFGAIHYPKPCASIWFGAIHDPKPYEFVWCGAIHDPKPNECIRFGAIHDPKTLRLYKVWCHPWSQHLMNS